jgi:choline/glycine/proline betaine transport protein
VGCRIGLLKTEQAQELTMFELLRQKLGLQVIPQVFFISAIIAALFVGISVPFHESVAALFGAVTGWISAYLGWFYIFTVTSLLVFLLYLALSRYGSIRLGPDHARPDYGTFTWFSMLFAAGIGTVLMFWGVAEPMSHFATPPVEGVAPSSRASAELAMNFAFYHFGLHTWTIFALPGLAIGYFAYRHELPIRISSLFYPLLGRRIYGSWGMAIDTVAVLGTLFGVATSIGLGTLQLNSGLNYVAGAPVSPAMQMMILAVITAIASISVALGLDRGILRLSQFNILIAIVLMLFILVVGPTVLILSGMIESTGRYLQNLPWMATWTEAFQGTEWQRSWTVFYWAWTISWAPYVGIFIARISRGRTIRQFVGGVLLAPTAFTIVWFSVFGLSAINLELNQGVALAALVGEDVSVALFSFLESFPLPLVISVMSVVIIVIFLTTSADSASLVIDMLSRRADQISLVRQRVFWALAQGSIAATLLLAGGFDALQNVITTLGFPFCVLLVFMGVALYRALRADYFGYDIEDMLAGRVPSALGDSAPPEVPETSTISAPGRPQRL